MADAPKLDIRPGSYWTRGGAMASVGAWQGQYWYGNACSMPMRWDAEGKDISDGESVPSAWDLTERFSDDQFDLTGRKIIARAVAEEPAAEEPPLLTLAGRLMVYIAELRGRKSETSGGDMPALVSWCIADELEKLLDG